MRQERSDRWCKFSSAIYIGQPSLLIGHRRIRKRDVAKSRPTVFIGKATIVTTSLMISLHLSCTYVYNFTSALFTMRQPTCAGTTIICYNTAGLLYQKSHFYIISNINNAIKMRSKCQNDGRL